MKKSLKIIIIIIVLLIIGALSYFITNKITTKHFNENNTIKNITINDFINEFNNNLKELELEESLSLENVVADSNNTYWLILNDEFDVAIKVDRITKKPEKDIVRLSGLAYNTDYEEKEEIEKYSKILLKTNNSKLSNKKINEILNSVNKIDDSPKTKITSELFEYRGLAIDKIKDETNVMYRIARYDGGK